MLWMISAALADGTGVWLRGTPDPTLDRELEHIAVEAILIEEGWTAVDDRAIANLASELEAVQPLLDVFDGELQIMRRLEDALADISALREEDRELVYRALLFQGLAVQRYFQDALADEPGAEPYRTTVAGRVVNRPWIDAVALAPDRQATAAEIPEAPERLQFQEARAQHLLAPTGEIIALNLPEGARLVVNGEEATSDRVRVLPGTHRAALRVDGTLSVRVRAVVRPDETLTLEPVAVPSDVAPLAAALSEKERAVLLPPGMQRTLSGLAAPVHLLVEDGRRTHHYVVEGRSAVLYTPPEDGTGEPDSGLRVRAVVGGGWLYDGDYLLQNASAGAPGGSMAVVNAATPLLSAGAELSLGPAVLGGGVDALLPVGEWHTLPSGEQTVRLRAYPHIEAGVGPVRVTAGWLFPWHIGVGPRTRLMLLPELGIELTAAYVHGIGVPLQYDNGDTFSPGQARTAWAGIGLRR